MLWNYIRFDFGESYFRDISVIDLIVEKMPVSISLGLWMTLLSYAISIPLGIRKAMQGRLAASTSGRAASSSSAMPFPASCSPSCSSSSLPAERFFDWFPLRGLTSDDMRRRRSGPGSPIRERSLDYFWHLVLPLTAMALSAFATTTLLTKNSFLDEIRKQYVMTARAKGLTERTVLYGHVFRNAMLIVIAGFPGAFISAFFAGSLLIETIFSLDGLGLLGFESVLNRDYPVVFATLYIFSLMGLVVNCISDLTYTWIDPRIDFETREV